jgi:hypothetical protein
MPKPVQLRIVHFFQGLLRRQSCKSHALAGGKNAGSAFAVVAVHEDFLLGTVAQEGLSGQFGDGFLAALVAGQESRVEAAATLGIRPQGGAI